jgi:hypothetical protein
MRFNYKTPPANWQELEGIHVEMYTGLPNGGFKHLHVSMDKRSLIDHGVEVGHYLLHQMLEKFIRVMDKARILTPEEAASFLTIKEGGLVGPDDKEEE